MKEENKLKLSWKKKIVYSAAAYFIAGSCIDKALQEVVPHFIYVGAACEKDYVPFCFASNEHSFLWSAMKGRRIGTNSLGYFAHEIKMPKPAGTYRIACFGGSTTFLPIADSYPNRLEELLDSDKTEVDFEIINASLMGYSVIEVQTQLEREFVNLDLDLAIVSEPWNFRSMSYLSNFVLGDRPSGRSLPQKLLGKLPLYPIIAEIMFFPRYLKNEEIQKRTTIDEQKPEEFEEWIRSYMGCIDRIYSLTRTHNIKLVLGTHPDLFGLFAGKKDRIPRTYRIDGMNIYAYDFENQLKFKRMVNYELRAYARVNNIPLIDWEAEFDNLPNRVELFTDPAHLNEAGTRKMAEIAKRTIDEILYER